MSSIFDLKTSVDELESYNQGTSRVQFDQHPPTRDCTGESFSNGAIRFKFSTSGQKWWMPSRSYIRLRLGLTKKNAAGADVPLTLDDGIAPNMGTCASLFQSAEMRINDKVVSRIGDFVPQIDALETRLSKSKSWMDSAGNSTNLWQTDMTERQSVVCADGVKSALVENQRFTPIQLGFAATDTVEIAVDTNSMLLKNAAGAPVLNGAAGSPSIQVGDIINVAGVKYVCSEATGGVAAFDIGNAKNLVLAASAFTVDRPINHARKAGQFELIWTPSLSLFKIDHALPAGNYELVLTPQPGTTYKQFGIESVGTPSLGNNAGNYNLTIEDIYFYCNVVDGKRSDDITYLLDLDATSCQSDNIKSTDLNQRNFDVSPSTYAMTVAYQDIRAGSTTSISASKFKSYNTPVTANTELNLTRFYMNYAGQSLPSPDADPNFNTGIDKTTQRYADTMLYNGGIFDAGGCETIEEFHRRGAYYYFAIPRDGSDRSTQVAVHSQFREPTVAQGGKNALTDNMRVLLFSHHKQVARVSVSDGRVVSVQLEDA